MVWLGSLVLVAVIYLGAILRIPVEWMSRFGVLSGAGAVVAFGVGGGLTWFMPSVDDAIWYGLGVGLYIVLGDWVAYTVDSNGNKRNVRQNFSSPLFSSSVKTPAMGVFAFLALFGLWWTVVVGACWLGLAVVVIRSGLAQFW